VYSVFHKLKILKNLKKNNKSRNKTLQINVTKKVLSLPLRHNIITPVKVPKK
jgi:hypothetical protein